MEEQLKTVLVNVGENRRIVSFSRTSATTDAEALTKSIKESFSDVLKADHEFFVQVKDEDWGGLFIDVQDKEIKDKSVVNVVLKPVQEARECMPPPSTVGDCEMPAAPVPPTAPVLPSDGQKGNRQMHLQLSGGALELTAPSPEETQESVSVNEDYITVQAKIYGRNSERSLSRYEQQMNEASIQLCLQNPNLLSDRTLLLKEARRVVNEQGYNYKKGKSRSRSLNPQTDVSADPPKRKKIGESYRLSRMEELQERIKDITDQLGYKEKRRESASMVHNYKECDQITEQMSELKCERRKLEIELTGLTKKQKKSKWYHAKRSKSLPGSSSDGTQQTLAFPHPSSSCSSSHSISPSPISHTSSGTSSPHYPLSPTSEAENAADAIILSSEDDQQGLLPIANEPESSRNASIEESTPTAEGDPSQFF